MNESATEAKRLIINAFPEYNLENLDCHGEIEEALAKNIESFTREQWEVILSHSTDYAFQSGVPHISWNTDRCRIFREIGRKFKRLSSWSSRGTWSDTTTVEYAAPNGMFFRLAEETPHAFSGGNYHYHIRIINADEVTPIFTHTAVILSLNIDGTAYIRSQKTGTLADCEKFVEQNMGSGMFFKIMERNNVTEM